MFSIIGILSFLAGFYLGDEMHLGYLLFKSSGGPLTIFPIAVIIYAVLLSIGLYISKERSLGFVLKVFGISFLFFFLAFYGIMACGAHEHYYAKYISVRTLSAPSDHLNLTEEELDKYPSLKEAIEQAEENNIGVVNLHPNEWKHIETSLGRAWLHTIKIGDEHYRIEFLCSLASQKLPEVPTDYVNVTEEELERHSILKRGKELADKFTDKGQPFKMSISLDNLLRIEDFLDEKALRTIEFGGEHYEFELISNLRVQKYYVNISEEGLEG
jgi:hypothetical protein